MKSYLSAVNCLLALALIIVSFCACVSSGSVTLDTAEQPSENEDAVESLDSDASVVNSLTLVDMASSCTLSFHTGAAPQYTVFKLSDPHRIIVDLPEFSISEHADFTIAENNFVANVVSEKIQDKDRDYLRLTIILRDDFSYITRSDVAALNINISNKTAEPVVHDKPVVLRQKQSPVAKPSGPAVVNAIVPHAGSDAMTLEIAAGSPIGEYKAYELRNPGRLVIDMPGAQSSVGKTLVNIQNDFLSRVRLGVNAESLRIVLDISSSDFPQYQIAKQDNSLLVHLQFDDFDKAAVKKELPLKKIEPAVALADEPQEETSQLEQPAEADEASESSELDTAEFAAQSESSSGPNISFDFKDADIKNVLRLIADISGKNMIISESVAGKVTIKLDDIPLDEALRLILDTHGLGKIDTGKIIRIETLERLKVINEEKLLTLRSHEEVVDLEIKTFNVSYSKAMAIVAFIKQLKVLSPRGNITAFKLTNKVTVKDIPANIPKIEALIREQDVPTRQVMIEARVVQSNPGYTKELGIRWGGTYSTTNKGNPLVIGGGAGGNQVVNLPAAAGLGSGGALNMGYITDKLTLDMQLSALENDDKIKIVSNPRVIGLDNQEARIKQGVALPYLTLNDNGVTSTEFKDAVLELEVTPKITPSDTISLEVKVTKNQKSAQTGAGNEPGIDIREVETFLLIESGVTAVIGGIYETQKTINIKRVPYFGTLPYIGYFFKNTKYEEQLTELLIFLTVTVLDAPEDLAQGFEPVSG